jgi:hypothetical protein
MVKKVVNCLTKGIYNALKPNVFSFGKALRDMLGDNAIADRFVEQFIRGLIDVVDGQNDITKEIIKRKVEQTIRTLIIEEFKETFEVINFRDYIDKDLDFYLYDIKSLIIEYITDHWQKIESPDFWEGLEDHVENFIQEQEVIYCTEALSILELDPCGDEVFSLASSYGYSVEDLNFSLLATLLLQERLSRVARALINEFENRVEYLIEELNELCKDANKS